MTQKTLVLLCVSAALSNATIDAQGALSTIKKQCTTVVRCLPTFPRTVRLVPSLARKVLNPRTITRAVVSLTAGATIGLATGAAHQLVTEKVILPLLQEKKAKQIAGATGVWVGSTLVEQAVRGDILSNYERLFTHWHIPYDSTTMAASAQISSWVPLVYRFVTAGNGKEHAGKALEELKNWQETAKIKIDDVAQHARDAFDAGLSYAAKKIKGLVSEAVKEELASAEHVGRMAEAAQKAQPSSEALTSQMGKMISEGYDKVQQAISSSGPASVNVPPAAVEALGVEVPQNL